MTRTRLHIILLLLMLPVAVLLAACSSDSEEMLLPDTPSGEPGMLQTGFSIVVSNNSSSGATRAPGYLGDGYDTGSGYENYIDITGGNFRFYFFDDRNILIAPMDVEAVLPAGGTATSKTYYVSGHTSENIKNKPLKVVALANWPSYPEPEQLQPGVTTIADICAGQYAFDAANTLPSSTNLIPLFGISLQQTLDFNVMNRAEIGTIHLLRAFAKVEVVKHHDCAVDIEWARIHRYNSRGFCAPQNVNNQDDYVHGSYDKDYVNTPHIPDGCETDSDITMVKTESGSFIAYIPEYRNLINGSPRPDSERTVLHVRFREDTEHDYDLVEFMDYAGNTGHFDVLRNYWYRFTLSKNLTPMVQMVPYNEVDLRPDFGLIVGANYVPVLDENDKVVMWYDPNTGKYYGLDKITEIKDPYISEDPATKWSLVRDENNRFFCYYDPVNSEYYATDKNTKILNPFENATIIYITVTNDDGTEVRKSVPCNKIVNKDTGKLYYYYDRANSIWYRPDLSHLNNEESPEYK